MPSSSHPLRDRFLGFVAEQAPLALTGASNAFDRAVKRPLATAAQIEAARAVLRKELTAALAPPAVPTALESTPGVRAADRVARGVQDVVEACRVDIRPPIRPPGRALQTCPDTTSESITGLRVRMHGDVGLATYTTIYDAMFKGEHYAHPVSSGHSALIANK